MKLCFLFVCFFIWGGGVVVVGMGCATHIVSHQGWVENSTPGIYRWNLPVLTGMANKAQVANNGK